MEQTLRFEMPGHAKDIPLDDRLQLAQDLPFPLLLIDVVHGRQTPPDAEDHRGKSF